MHTALFIDNILVNIISRLNLRKKFAIQVISNAFKATSMIHLKQQKSLVITNDLYGERWMEDMCPHHPWDNSMVIHHDLRDWKVWRRILEAMPNIQFLFFNIEIHTRKIYRTLLQTVIMAQSRKLVCLQVPYHYSVSSKDQFPFVTDLPQLKHISFYDISDASYQQLTAAAPNLTLIGRRAPDGFVLVPSNKT